MSGFSKFSFFFIVLLSALSATVAQQTRPVTVEIPFSGAVGNVEVSFDLLGSTGIVGAAHNVCYKYADKLGLTTDDAVQKQCILPVEEHITAVLLANKIVERTPSRSVSLTIPVDELGSFDVTFDPTKSTPTQTAEYLCVEKQKELKITTQEQLDNICIPRIAEFISRNLKAQEAAAANLKPAPVATTTVSKDMRTISIPIENIGTVPLEIDINSVSANQAAEYVCTLYAGQLQLNKEGVTEHCIPPISAYIQNYFETTNKPNIQQMTMPVANSGDVSFSFDANKVNPESVAEEICVSKQADWGINSREALISNCIPPVSQFITNTLRDRKVIA